MTRLRKLLTLCLVAALLAGVGLAAAPVTATAAPLAASTAQAGDVSGSYVSDVYPAASAPGLVLLMSLYPNNNAEVVSYYFSNPPVIEQGTWESSGDSVTVSLTGNSERTYDEPSVETFTVAEGGLTSGNFVFHKLDTITPEQMDAASDAAAQEPAATAEPAAEATATETPAEEPAASDEAATEPPVAADPAPMNGFEVFVTDVYPAADASGLVTLMALFPNNNMEQLSVYLGKDAILEVGTWSEDGSGTVETTLTGQFDGEEYGTAVTATFTREGDQLSDGVFTFHQMQVITPADIEAMMNPAGTYVSKLYPAADAPGMLTVLSLFENNNVEQVTIYIGKDAVMEQGTWAGSGAGGPITVTIDRSGDTVYDAPTVTEYMYSGDTLRDGDFELTRIEEVTPAQMEAASGESAADATPEATSEATPEATAEPTEEAAGSDATGDEDVAPVAVYQSDTLPAADSPGRVITLSLYEDGSRAEMTTDFLNETPLIVETGTWESTEEGKLTVTLTHAEGQGEYATPIVITFDDVDGVLTAVDYDPSLFGTEGLTLSAVQ